MIVILHLFLQVLQINIHFNNCFIEKIEHLYPTIEINQEKQPFIGIDFKFRNLRAFKIIDIIE